MSSTLSQQLRTTRITPGFVLPSGRDENTSQGVTPFRASGFQNIWANSLAQNRDASHSARGSSGQPWPRVSPTDDAYPERTISSDPVPVPSTSGFSRTTDERNWNQSGWTSSEAVPATLRTAGSSPPNRTRDSYLGTQDQPFGHTLRNSLSRPTSLLDDDQENRGFAAGLNGNLDMDPSRRQDSRAPGFRSLGDAPSRDPSLPPSRGTNGSPAMQERFAFAGGHTPNNSIGLSRNALTAASPYTASPTNPGLSSRSFDATARRGQQYDANNSLVGMGTLSLDDRPASSANSTGFNSTPQAQGWPNNGSTSARYLHDLVPLNGVPSAAQAGSPYGTLNRGSVPAHGSPTFAPGGAQYTSQDKRSQRPSSRDLLIRSQANGRTPPVYVDQVGSINQAANAWYPNSFFTPELSGLHTNLYAPAAQHNLRIPGYPMPANPYLPGGTPLGFQTAQNQDPGAEMRGALLEEYRNSKFSGKWDLQIIFGHISEFSGDMHGSRFVQSQLESASSDERDRVFSEIKYNVIQLMKDVYGNYVVQKFFDLGNQVQKKALAAQMKPKFYELSTHMYGCRVVQKALDHVLLEQQLELINVLKPNMLQLMQNSHGNHVVQKIIDVIPRKFLDFVMDAMRGQIVALSGQRFGCRVVQKMLDKGTDKDRKDIFNEFYAAANVLAPHEFGNYVAQVVLEKGAEEDKAELITLLTPMAVALSKQQAASNVVEKCILFGTAEHVRGLHQEFTNLGLDRRSQLVGMMLNPYANYTIQRLFEKFGTRDEVGNPDQAVTPDQQRFREEVQRAMESLTKEERNNKSVFAVAEILGIRIPGISVPIPAGGEERGSTT